MGGRRHINVALLALFAMLGLAGSSSARIVGGGVTSVRHAQAWTLHRRVPGAGLYEIRLNIRPGSKRGHERLEIFVQRFERRDMLVTNRGVTLSLRTRVASGTLTVRVAGSRITPLVRAYVRLIAASGARIAASTRQRNNASAHSAAAPPGSPSGVPMPTGNLPGWRRVFADNFNGSSLDSRWRTYSGQPGGDPGGLWAPSHVSVANGMLILSAYRDPADGNSWTTGGVSSSPGLVQTYGKYLVRFRFDSGVGIAHAILLWPADNSWPPEVDFSEDNGAGRQTDYATLHYGPSNTQIQHSLSVDLTQWHTLGVEWTPGRLVYTIDGRSWTTVNDSHVPSVPMVLDIQTQAWACGTSTWEQCPNATTPPHVNLYVDWVVAYAPA